MSSSLAQVETSLISAVSTPWPWDCEVEAVSPALTFRWIRAPMVRLPDEVLISCAPVNVRSPSRVRVEPANVRFASAVIALAPVPVRTALSVSVEAPVPPYATPTSVPYHVPAAIVPALAMPAEKVVALAMVIASELLVVTNVM